MGRAIGAVDEGLLGGAEGRPVEIAEVLGEQEARA